MSQEEVRHSMLKTALDIIRSEGLTVSLHHILMDDLVVQAGVARSAAYRVWPNRELFLKDLLLALASDPKYSPVAFDPSSLRLAMDFVGNQRANLNTPEARRKTLIETCRAAAIHNFSTTVGRGIWNTHIAIVAAVSSYPADRRFEIDQRIETAAEVYLDSMTRFYEAISPPLGIEPRKGFTFEMIAAAGSSIIEGMVLRDQSVHNLSESFASFGEVVKLDPFGCGSSEWTIPSVAFTANFLTMTQPVADYKIEKFEEWMRYGYEVVSDIELYGRTQSDRATARSWWEKVAQRGRPGAMFRLGELAVEDGDREKAREWLLRAADQGHLGAMFRLGELAVEDGNHEKAREWLLRAADQEHLGAMLRLGELAAEGGDRDSAREWWRRALEMGSQDARDALVVLAEDK